MLGGGGLNPIRKLILSTEHIDQNLNFVSEREGNFAELNWHLAKLLRINILDKFLVITHSLVTGTLLVMTDFYLNNVYK